VQIELVDRSHGVRTAVFPTRRAGARRASSSAVNAQMAERLRSRSPSQSKLGPQTAAQSVNHQLPGVVRAAARRPRQAAVPAGFTVSSSTAAAGWRQLEESGSLALHVAGDFPALELELWAIRLASPTPAWIPGRQ
jgi:type VI secretion system protein ImpJ